MADYPVFTRKAMTDANFLACAARMFEAERLYPQFATHNAQTAAAIVVLAGARRDYEFQRLHGMGEALHDALSLGAGFLVAFMRRWDRIAIYWLIWCAA